jgi:hypothetical protein
MRDGKSQIDPAVKCELKIAAMVKNVGAEGVSHEEVQALIDSLDKRKAGTRSFTPFDIGEMNEIQLSYDLCKSLAKFASGISGAATDGFSAGVEEDVAF